MPINVNKKFLPRVKETRGIHSDSPFEKADQDTPRPGDSSYLQASLPYEFQPACQQLQGMHYLNLRTMLFEAI
jgi:hypothetical protein